MKRNNTGSGALLQHLQQMYGGHQEHQDDEALLTVKELSQWLGISESACYDLTRHRAKIRHQGNQLPCIRIGTALRFRKKDVRDWLDRLSAYGNRK
jgi:excisionase family DNA binding protein